MLLKAAMPFNFSSPEYLSHHRTRKNRVSPVSRASPAHMNSPLVPVYTCVIINTPWRNIWSFFAALNWTLVRPYIKKLLFSLSKGFFLSLIENSRIGPTCWHGNFLHNTCTAHSEILLTRLS